ncbi:MAG: class I SAM-dependent methyltransferase [Chitinophagales bacterium]
MLSNSRFAKFEEIFSEEYAGINKELIALQKKHQLQDHEAINKSRFSWADKITDKPMYYAARMWEFPYAIFEAQLQMGMKVADVGCGNTPFTALLAERVGAQNVTGYDPDYIQDDNIEGHSHFGARKSYIDALGINFYKDGMTKMTAEDNTFDRVFCISVLEHIEELHIKQQGLKEMARILKPGGKLILTFDVALKMPLNDIFQNIQFTGLIPSGSIDFHWPEKRFVKYEDGSTVDVFGIILEKPNYLLDADYEGTSKIPAYKATDLSMFFTEHYAVSYEQILAARDLKRPFGSLRVFIKSLLNKY